jgi:hypothetical protein
VRAMRDSALHVFDSDDCLPKNHWTVIGEAVHADGSVTCELRWIEPGPEEPAEPLVTVEFREDR